MATFDFAGFFRKCEKFKNKYSSDFVTSGLDKLRADYIGKHWEDLSGDSGIYLDTFEILKGKASFFTDRCYLVVIDDNGIITGFENGPESSVEYHNKGPVPMF